MILRKAGKSLDQRARDRSEMNTWKLNDEAAAENRPPKRRKKQSVEQEFFSQFPKS
uniref:Uncharacterized protein n=1 Tax=Fusarium oxysporum (strain Fo5176) TaxID=660025 RepID=A0A0D2XR55_FUSOF